MAIVVNFRADDEILFSFISAIPGMVCCLVAPNTFFMAFPNATCRALSNGATHFDLRRTVAEILRKNGVLTGIPSVKIISATRGPILAK